MNLPDKLPPPNPLLDEEWKENDPQIEALKEMVGEFIGRFQEMETLLEIRADKIDDEQALLKAEAKEVKEMLAYIRAEIKRGDV